MSDRRVSADNYESPELLAQYLLMHYGPDEAGLPWIDGPRPDMHFPLRCVSEGLDLSRLGPKSRGLDIACAVGASSFELARHCGEVIGVDYSQMFVDTANRLQAEGSLPYTFPEVGRQMGRAIARVPADIDRTRVSFRVGDAHALPAELGQFDVVLCCNVLCRLREPQRLLDQLAGLVKPGGQLLVTTPESWDEQYTPEENWLSGRPGQPPLLETLKGQLLGAFTLSVTGDLPFCIREHRRKFQWGVAQASRWTRRNAPANAKGS